MRNDEGRLCPKVVLIALGSWLVDLPSHVRMGASYVCISGRICLNLEEVQVYVGYVGYMASGVNMLRVRLG